MGLRVLSCDKTQLKEVRYAFVDQLSHLQHINLYRSFLSHQEKPEIHDAGLPKTDYGYRHT